MATRNNFHLNFPPCIDETSVMDLNIPASIDGTPIIDLNIPASIDETPIIGLNIPASIEEILMCEGSPHVQTNFDEVREQMQHTGKKNLSNDERSSIFIALMQRSDNGKLKSGSSSSVASQFGVSLRTVQRIWKQAKESSYNGKFDVSHRKIKNCGRKRIELDMERFRDIPLSQRTSLRSISCQLGVGTTTLFRQFKSGDFSRHSNAIKPYLTEDNKKVRLQFCMSMLDNNTLPQDPTFVDMYNIVYIDEKWFYLTKKSNNYYLLQEEEDPVRTCKSKNFITKVMFLVAIARPRFDAEQNELFSGKIGIFPFIIKEPAKRTSVNRAAGTLETKAMNSVVRETIKAFLIEKVLPSIRAKWPIADSKSPIFIQQDNARTHVDPNHVEFCAAAKQDGFDIRLICQPANFPDL